MENLIQKEAERDVSNCESALMSYLSNTYFGRDLTYFSQSLCIFFLIADTFGFNKGNKFKPYHQYFQGVSM